MLIETDDVVCGIEIAELAGVTPSAVSNWRKRHADFPLPLVELRTGPLWARADIEAWIAGRSVDEAERTRVAIAQMESRLATLRSRLPTGQNFKHFTVPGDTGAGARSRAES